MGKMKHKVKNWVKDNPKIYSIYKKSNFRNITSTLRITPDFLIIGVQKCGTTSLHEFICQHPCVIPPTKKEIHYFSTFYAQNIRWYKTHFPLLIKKNILEKIKGHKVITGEASPYYIYHPLAAKRIRETIPEAKFIVIFRNPVDRAYSHYNHSFTRK